MTMSIISLRSLSLVFYKSLFRNFQEIACEREWVITFVEVIKKAFMLKLAWAIYIFLNLQTWELNFYQMVPHDKSNVAHPNFTIVRTKDTLFEYFGPPSYGRSYKIICNIFAISPEKNGNEVDFCLKNKHENFLQVHSITLGVHSQACPNHAK